MKDDIHVLLLDAPETSINADLQRCVRSCHPFREQRPSEVLKCINPTCPSPEKVFNRKHNLNRHIRRCVSRRHVDFYTWSWDQTREYFNTNSTTETERIVPYSSRYASWTEPVTTLNRSTNRSHHQDEQCCDASDAHWPHPSGTHWPQRIYCV